MVKATRSRGGVGEPGTTEFVRGPLDGRHVARPTVARPIVAITRPDPCLIEDVVEDLVRPESPGVFEPRNVGEKTARAQDPARLAQRPGTIRHQLEDERRERGIERAILEWQAVGEGSDGLEAAAVVRRQACIGVRIGHLAHRRRGVDADDRYRRPTGDGSKRQLAGSRSYVQDPIAPGQHRVGHVEELGHRGRQDRRPAPCVSGRYPVVPLALIRHGRIVPRRRPPFPPFQDRPFGPPRGDLGP